MATYISNRNSNGKTDENGHFRLPLKAFDGEVFSGFNVKANNPNSMILKITPGDAKIPYQDYSYAVWSDAEETVTLDNASPTNQRIDAVVAYVDRMVLGTATTINNKGALKFKAVAGSPSGSPIAPTDGAIKSAIGAGNPYIVLAEVAVAQGTTLVTQASIKKVSKPIAISSNVALNNVTSLNGQNLKFAIRNEGETLPAADPNATTVVFITR